MGDVPTRRSDYFRKAIRCRSRSPLGYTSRYMGTGLAYVRVSFRVLPGVRQGVGFPHP
jgi:hypothetical protein